MMFLTRRAMGASSVALLAGCATGTATETATTAPARDPAAIGAWGVDLGARDLNVKPGDDFFRYAQGTWMANTQIPADRTRWGTFDILREKADNDARVIIEASSLTKSVWLQSGVFGRKEFKAVGGAKGVGATFNTADKAVYEINLAGAVDVSQTTLPASGAFAGAVTKVAKVMLPAQISRKPNDAKGRAVLPSGACANRRANMGNNKLANRYPSILQASNRR